MQSWVLLLCTLIMILPLRAEEYEAISVDELIEMEYVFGLSVSPDSNYVCWEQRKTDTKEDEIVTHLWISKLTEKPKPKQLTRSKASEWSPRWSPDGQNIAFLSDRQEEKTQVFVVHTFGGEAEQLTECENGVKAFAWVDDDTILFLARENPYFHEKEKKENKDDALAIEDVGEFYPARLFRITVDEDKEIKRITENNDQIIMFSVSPDGQWVITKHVDSPLHGNDPRVRPYYFLTHLATNEKKEIFTVPYFDPIEFIWSSDSRYVYLMEKFSQKYSEQVTEGVPLLYRFEVAKQSLEEMNLQWEKGLASLEFNTWFSIGKNYLMTLLANGAVNNPAFFDLSQNPPQIQKIDHEYLAYLDNYQLTPDDEKIVFVHSRASKPPQLYWAPFNKGKIGAVTTITDMNPDFKERSFTKVEVIQWKSNKDRIIEGILYYPKDYKEGKKYPLMVATHGGPMWYDADSFQTGVSYPYQILTHRGMFVLCTNYSGSCNYGLEMLESIYGNYYDEETADILSGVEHLISRGMVDEKQMGVMGWSNGSILSIHLTIVTDRFKVACCGAGDVNWTSDYGNCSFGVEFDNIYMGGPPWKIPQVYMEKSPLFKMEKVTTPTIIFFGDKDTAVPTSQGWEHFRALQQIGKAPVRFVLFPDEEHSLSRPSHQKRKLEEELAWIDRYLFEKKDEKLRSLKEKSPLALARDKMKRAQTSMGYWGIEKNGMLLPEMVEYSELKVSCFEITRAQFDAFVNHSKELISGWQYRPIEGNFPAGGITWDQANRYVEWLNQVTGEKYRLPKEDEMSEWLEDCEEDASENNLEYWADYKITPEEATELATAIMEIKNKQGFLKPVGSFAPSTEGLYDLNGNVAEWCVQENNTGKILGGCATLLGDTRQPYRAPGVEMTGFRVVLGTGKIVAKGAK